jgi:hypothetical protein
MLGTIERIAAFTVYQLSLLLGLLLLPVALVARQGGVTLPFDKLLERSRRAHAAARDRRR